MATTITAEAQVRARNQVTIPESIVRAGGIEAGETLIVEIEPSSPDTLRIRRVRESYAGALSGLWGSDSRRELEADRDSWE